MSIINQDVSKIKDNSESIMRKLYDNLIENNIDCQINSKESEIIINDKSQFSSISELLKTSDIPKSVYSDCLLDTITVENSVYIRQKTK